MQTTHTSRREFLALAGGSVFGSCADASFGSRFGANRLEPVSFVFLKGGRRVAYAEYGNPMGPSVVLYHGLPSCRLEGELFRAALTQCPAVRLIALDRPGVGASDSATCSSYRSWASDLALCADALGVSRFGLAGSSAGTPFVLAAALELRERVTVVSLACPVAELTPGGDNGSLDKALRAARRTPHLTAGYLNALGRQVARTPGRIVSALEPLTPAERRRFHDPEAVALAARLVSEALRGGASGVVRELAHLGGPWGIELSKITAPVSIFTGGQDRHAPPSMAKKLASSLPGATLAVSDRDGHISLLEHLALPILTAAVR
jgi:pimeloyl-ACP methyl ester carboxylesterase